MEKKLKRIIKSIQEYYYTNKLDRCVIGISGGKDSAVVAAIMCKALGKENVVGIAMPCNSNDKDKSDAEIVSNYYGFKLYTIDLTKTFDIFKQEITHAINFDETHSINSDINLKPKLRMSTNYYVAALLSSIHQKKYIVVGTSNKCELYVGYITKGGDTVYDINPIKDLLVSEVIELGKLLKVPKEILYKTPSDGLSNLTDEEKLGVTYNEIEMFLLNKQIKEESKQKIQTLHKNSLHKFNIPIYEEKNK